MILETIMDNELRENAADEKISSKMCEGMAAYAVQKRQEEKKQGDYTIHDFYHFPDDRRVELINGVIYDMASPSNIHQAVAAQLYVQILEHINKKRGRCFPIISPVDVQLDCDEKTIVQPDVMVVCDRSKIGKVVYGAPDFVAEVLSDSTRQKDMGIKRIKYQRAGVKEYWIIDPDKKSIIAYDFVQDSKPRIYGFDSKIPIRVLDGECKIDFGRIYEFVCFLYYDEEDSDE